MASFYKGMCTRGYEATGTFGLFDVALVEDDLLNELFTAKGDRLHMPEFGTRIPLLVFEPNDGETMEILEEDIRSVISRDPRVSLDTLKIFQDPDRGVLIALVKINYLEFNVVRDINIEIGSR